MTQCKLESREAPGCIDFMVVSRISRTDRRISRYTHCPVINISVKLVHACTGQAGCVSAWRRMGADSGDAQQGQVYTPAQKSYPGRPDECQARHVHCFRTHSLFFTSTATLFFCTCPVRLLVCMAPSCHSHRNILWPCEQDQHCLCSPVVLAQAYSE